MLISPEKHGIPWQFVDNLAQPLNSRHAKNHHDHHGNKADKLGGSQSTNPSDKPNISATAMSYQAYSAESSMQLEIATKDGDKITINIARSYQEQNTALQQVYGQGMLSANEFNRNASMQLDFTVDGNLSVDEEKAIKDLMHQLNGVVKHFDNNNSDQALAQAANIKLDSTLASFSLDLKSHEESQSTVAYEVKPQAASTTIEDEGSDLAQKLAALMHFADKQTPIKNPMEALRTLFDALKQYANGETTSSKDPVSQNNTAPV